MKEMRWFAKEIEWDTDGISTQKLNLRKNMEIPEDKMREIAEDYGYSYDSICSDANERNSFIEELLEGEEIADYLSDTTGYCLYSWNLGFDKEDNYDDENNA